MNYVINQNEKYKEYLCSKNEDILNISLKNLIPGSKAYVPSTTNVFILGPDYKWYNKNTGEIVENQDNSTTLTKVITMRQIE